MPPRKDDRPLEDPKDGGDDRPLTASQVNSYHAEQNQVNPYNLGTHKPEPWDTNCQWCDRTRRVVHAGPSMDGAPARRTLVCPSCDRPPKLFDANELDNIVKGSE